MNTHLSSYRNHILLHVFCVFLSCSLPPDASSQETNAFGVRDTYDESDRVGFEVLANLPELELVALRTPPRSDRQFAVLTNHPTLESAFMNGRDLSESNVIETIKTIPTPRYRSVDNNKSLQHAVNSFIMRRQALSAGATNRPAAGKGLQQDPLGRRYDRKGVSFLA